MTSDIYAKALNGLKRTKSKDAVQSINREQVEMEERLSDNVYYFRKDGDKVEAL